MISSLANRSFKTANAYSTLHKEQKSNAFSTDRLRRWWQVYHADTQRVQAGESWEGL